MNRKIQHIRLEMLATMYGLEYPGDENLRKKAVGIDEYIWINKQNDLIEKIAHKNENHKHRASRKARAAREAGDLELQIQYLLIWIRTHWVRSLISHDSLKRASHPDFRSYISHWLAANGIHFSEGVGHPEAIEELAIDQCISSVT